MQESSAKTKYGLWEGIAQLAGYIDTSDPSISSGRDEKKEEGRPSRASEEEKSEPQFKNENGLVDKSGSTADTAPE